MNRATKKLISVSSASLADQDQGQGFYFPRYESSTSAFFQELRELLRERNGFFAFEGALRIFPSTTVLASYGLDEWNSSESWRYEYEEMAERCFFFAEDIFGSQFCFHESFVCSFDPETGQISKMCESLEGWCEVVLSDYEVLTGFRIAHDWQIMNGPIPGRHRLVPKVPFVVGGEFGVTNLVSVDAISGMRARGNLARQIRDLPDGSAIKFKIT